MRTPPSEHRAEPERGGETILVVEDDALVRSYVAGPDSEPRLRHARGGQRRGGAGRDRQRQPIDLLFTDVIMPGGMNGRELAEEARKRRPGIRVLFTSGYTENAIVHHGRLDPGVLLLAKPYRRSDLATLIRARPGGPDALRRCDRLVSGRNPGRQHTTRAPESP